jgi:hypothetical protein
VLLTCAQAGLKHAVTARHLSQSRRYRPSVDSARRSDWKDLFCGSSGFGVGDFDGVDGLEAL